jgi:sensor c-di-GMP phosphodiesterase-like protein
MKQFTRRNALTATVLNLIINIVAPSIIFRTDGFFNFKGESPTLVDLLLPTVLISVFATTLATFVTMTKQRMAQKLQPALAPATSWIGTAVLTSVILAVAFAFAGLFILLTTGLHSLFSNFQLSKWAALGLSGVVGAVVALTTSFIAVQRSKRVC